MTGRGGNTKTVGKGAGKKAQDKVKARRRTRPQ
jgi:hypothetical protein